MSSEQNKVGQERGVRIGRILDAFVTARQRGEPVSESELYAKHPDIALELRQHLSLLRDLPSPADKIDSLISQGILERCDDERYSAQLGAYKIVDYIGRGGMGIVLKAYEESLNRTVALKILRPELADDRVALERFTREAKAAAALNHPNIVTVHAVGHNRGVPFIAMEYVSGPSLAEAIKSGQRSANSSQLSAVSDQTCGTGMQPVETPQSEISHPATVRHIFRQLLEALAAAHAAGLIHRDVKSSNILLEAGEEHRDRGAEGSSECGVPYSVKLADFGLARMLSSQTRVTAADSILGTPEYMSPEQARGDADIDHRTDLYSAGVVLYELLTGRVPFKADTPSAVIHQILNVEPPEPRTIDDDVDPVLASIAMRLMAKETDRRLGSAMYVTEALDRGEPVTDNHTQRFTRRRTSQATLMVATILIIAWFATTLKNWVTFPAVQTTTTAVDKDSVIVRTNPLFKREVQIRFPDQEWTTLKIFPVEIEEVTRCVLIQTDGVDSLAVVIGFKRPLGGCNLLALDIEGRELWRQNLSSKFTWPGCGPSAVWCCGPMCTANLDNNPGEELVVECHDLHSYGTIIALIDPRDEGSIRSRFWHMGQTLNLLSAPGLLEADHTAIVGWGNNNKLDEYPLRSDLLTPATGYSEVTALFVLAPESMDGSGPPFGLRLDGIPICNIHAYAFIDLSVSIPEEETMSENSNQTNQGVLPRSVEITKVDYVPSANGSSNQPNLKVFVDDPYLADVGAVFTVDSKLNLLDVDADYQALHDFWSERWRVITDDESLASE